MQKRLTACWVMLRWNYALQKGPKRTIGAISRQTPMASDYRKSKMRIASIKQTFYLFSLKHAIIKKIAFYSNFLGTD